MCHAMTASLALIISISSSISSGCFSEAFVFVHAFIRPVYRVADRRIAGGIVWHDSDGDSRLLPSILGSGTEFLADFRKAVGQRIPVSVILVLQNDSEFIAADSENGAVLKDAADHLACGFDINVAFIMSILVVDLFQIVAIEYAYGKLDRLAAVQPLLQLLDMVRKGALVSNGRECVEENTFVQIIDQAFFLDSVIDMIGRNTN